MKKATWLILVLLLSVTLGTGVLAKTPVKVTEIYSANSPLVDFRIILRAGSINDWRERKGSTPSLRS